MNTKINTEELLLISNVKKMEYYVNTLIKIFFSHATSEVKSKHACITVFQIVRIKIKRK